MQHLLVLSLFLLSIFAANSSAERIAFDFTGIVLPVGDGAPFGESIPPFAPVSGHFEFDTTNPVTHTINSDTVGFRQQIPSGFSAQFGTTSVVADDYIVALSNDGPTSEDQFIVRFIKDGSTPILDPTLSAPLLVNGTPHHTGRFDISLVGPTTVFAANTSLPSSLDFSQFSGFSGGFLSDTPGPVADVFFQVLTVQEGAVQESVVQTPEPDSIYLFFCVLISMMLGHLWFGGLPRPCRGQAASCKPRNP